MTRTPVERITVHIKRIEGDIKKAVCPGAIIEGTVSHFFHYDGSVFVGLGALTARGGTQKVWAIQIRTKETWKGEPPVTYEERSALEGKTRQAERRKAGTSNNGILVKHKGTPMVLGGRRLEITPEAGTALEKQFDFFEGKP